MSFEKQIKRTIYVSQCECGDRDVKDGAPPRERLCNCGKWVVYKEESYTGPELAHGR